MHSVSGCLQTTIRLWVVVVVETTDGLSQSK